MVEIEAVDGAVAEGEEGGQERVDDVGGEQVQNDSPVLAVLRRGPGAQDANPEQERGAEEAEVLDYMPVLVLEREVVGRGDVPG